ncbi:hypothetical protein BC831DRAFT_516404, partial [Entophlyctis helioformis]
MTTATATATPTTPPSAFMRFMGYGLPRSTLPSATTSRILSPSVLAGCRLVAACYVLVFGLMYIIPEGGHYFRFLTNLSWMGIS